MLQCNIIMAVQQKELTDTECSVKFGKNVFPIDWSSHSSQSVLMEGDGGASQRRDQSCWATPRSKQQWQIGRTNDLHCDKG
jgi:hypothetical protein